MCLLQEEAKPPGSDGPLDGGPDPPGMLLCQEAEVWPENGLCSDLEWVCVSFWCQSKELCASSLCTSLLLTPRAPSWDGGAGGGRRQEGDCSGWLWGHSVSQ